MVRSMSRAIGLVIALAALAAGCAVQPASSDEVRVETNGTVSADGVPMLEVRNTNPCGSGEPQPWMCGNSSPTPRGGGANAQETTAGKFEIGRKWLPTGALEVPSTTAPATNE